MTDVLLWLAAVLVLKVLAFGLVVLFAHRHYCKLYLPNVVRVFEERPLFIIPRGNPDVTAEDVTFPGPNGLLLRGCYMPAKGHPRRGVILFGLEFGSNRWSAGPYCERLLDAGYDVFAYESRNQGDSQKEENYQPLQWVTDRDKADAMAAVSYLKSRPDYDAVAGYGVFGISKGGSVCMMAVAGDPDCRCVATDGAFATYTTMVPYMRRWVSIFRPGTPARSWVPDWFYGIVGLSALRHVSKKRSVKFPHMEKDIRRFGRPWLLIHGGADNYIKPEMAHALAKKAKAGTAEVWVVERAKHNQALHIAGEEYHRKLVEFFDEHLAKIPPPDSTPDLPPITPIPEESHTDTVRA